ncbi:MAG: hypothetical protein ACK5BL_06610 [Flavobacteriales bacterium]
MVSRIILILICFIALRAEASVCPPLNPLPKTVRIFPDLAGYWFLDGKLAFGCEVTYVKGGKRRTPGYLNGNLPWRELQCSSEQATQHGDCWYVDLYKVRQNNNTLVIYAQHRDNASTKTSFEIKIPPIQSVEVVLPENTKPRYGKSIEPIVHLEWANGVGYSYKASNVRSLVPRDSVALYYNNERSYDGQIVLPEFSISERKTFSLSALWVTKPWLNDVEVFPFQGSAHTTWKFKLPDGADGRKQLSSPRGMDGVEGFHGMPGMDAPEVTLSLTMSPDGARIVAEANNGRIGYRKEFKPEEFSLEIIARGGNGGDGGRGGDGGAAPFDDPEKAGIGGQGGRGGRGGIGAKLTIQSTPETESFIPCVVIDNSDGLPGKPGEGGRGGTFGGAYGMPTLFEMIFPSRNYDGEPGDE